MHIWLDTADLEWVQKTKKFGFLYGVTTNPSIIRESGKPIEKVLAELTKVQSGPVTAQVTAETAAGMFEEGLQWSSQFSNLIIKVPATQEGFQAIHQLSRQSIPTMATIVFHPHQALLAALAGASYIAPYLTRMEEAGINSKEAIASMMKMIGEYSFSCKILAASVSSLEQIEQCMTSGVHGVTLKKPMFDQLFSDSPHTLKALQKFREIS